MDKQFNICPCGEFFYKCPLCKKTIKETKIERLLKDDSY